MVWVSHRFGAPTTRTYAQALAYYESVTPIRGSGRNGGKRPIGKRNGLTYMTKDEGTGQISFWLYQTPVLVFNTDDTIKVSHGHWVSSTTATFMSEVINTTVSVKDRELHLIHYHGAMRDEQTHIIQDGMTIKYTTDQHGQVDIVVQGSKPVFTHRLNRQRWKEVRGKFKQFREYISLMSTLEPQFTNVDSAYPGHRARYLSTDSRTMSWQADDKPCVSFLVDVAKAQENNDLGAMLELMRELALNHCPTKWHRVPKPNAQPGDSAMFDYEVTVTLKKDSLLKGLDELMKHALSRELFLEERLPDGKYTKDSNYKYVKYAPNEVEYNELKAVI